MIHLHVRLFPVDYIPDLTQLPSCILRLATDVEWNVEKDCFDTFSRVMARFYRRPNDREVSFAPNTTTYVPK